MNPAVISIEKPVLVFLNEALLEVGPRELLKNRTGAEAGRRDGISQRATVRARNSATDAFGQLQWGCQAVWGLDFTVPEGRLRKWRLVEGGRPCRPRFGRKPSQGLLPRKANLEQAAFAVDPVGCELHTFITNCQLSPSRATV